MKDNESTVDFTRALKDGVVVNVDTVPNGIACRCVCPSCELPLIAHNNPKNKNAHHFQHQSRSDCRNYYETMIHYLAKEVISELGELIVPMHTFELSDYARSYAEYEWAKNNPRERVESYKIKFDSVLIEKQMGNIKPDLFCVIDDKEIHIEIAVTHFVDEIKTEKIKDQGVVALEIDLSSFDRDIGREELKEFFAEGDISRMKWINNKAVQKRKWATTSMESTIRDFVHSNTRKQKVYGKAKSVYKCPIIEKEYDITLSNCKSCRFLSIIEERLESTPQEVFDESRMIYSNVYIGCLGHVSDQFDSVLKRCGVEVGKNKAFKGGVSPR